MEIQKTEILSFVDIERRKGRSLAEVLLNLKVSKSNYYRWKKNSSDVFESTKARTTVRSLTEEDQASIDEMKERHPEMRHRQIQGMLQLQGTFVSSTSVYKRLKENNQVEPYARRAAPWKEPHYEVYKANVMWGADWTKLRIGGMR